MVYAAAFTFTPGGKLSLLSFSLPPAGRQFLANNVRLEYRNLCGREREFLIGASAVSLGNLTSALQGIKRRF